MTLKMEKAGHLIFIAIGLFFGLVAGTTAAHAQPKVILGDQFKTAVPDGTVMGFVSKREVSRISLVKDRIQSIKRIQSSAAAPTSTAAQAPLPPGGDFAFEVDPATGDMYVSVSPALSEKYVGFFIRSELGHTYRFHLEVKDVPSTQLFVRNPEIQNREAEEWERKTSYNQATVRLLKAMWNGDVVPGYEIKSDPGKTRFLGPFQVQSIAHYGGNSFEGHEIRLRNVSDEGREIVSDAFIQPGTAAITVKDDDWFLAPGEETSLFLILSRGQ